MAGAPGKNTANFVETEIDDEAVLMNIATGDFFSLSGTALAIWKLIDGQRTVPAIAAELAAVFAAPQDEVMRDVEAFVAELAGLAIVSDG